MAGDKARQHNIQITRSTEIHLDLDDAKVEAIKSCLSSGKLTIKVSEVDLAQAGRLQAAYEYD